MRFDETNHTDNDNPSFHNIKFDDATFEALFKQYFIPLCTYCQYKFGFDLSTAKEVVHTGFIKLWETRHTIAPNLSIKAYLYKIVTNNSLDIIKHETVKQKYKEYTLQHTAEITFENTDFKQLETDITRAISELPEQMRLIFELSRYEGLKYAQIANHLNISIKTVETQMSRALVKLRQKLAHYLLLLIIVLVSILIKK